MVSAPEWQFGVWPTVLPSSQGSRQSSETVRGTKLWKNRPRPIPSKAAEYFGDEDNCSVQLFPMLQALDALSLGKGIRRAKVKMISDIGLFSLSPFSHQVSCPLEVLQI